MTTSSLITKDFLGVGKVFVRAYAGTGKRRFVGNVSGAAFKIGLDTFKHPDYTRLGGGTASRYDRIKEVGCDMTMLSFVTENLQLALAASATPTTAGTVSGSPGESAVAFKGAPVRLTNPPATITSVKDAATGLVTYTAGTDYELSAGGLWIPDGSSIPDATGTPPAANIKVAYTFLDYTTLEAAVSAVTPLEMLIEGLNEADSGKAVVIDAWRVLLPPAAELAVMTNGLGELKFSGELLKDPTKGTGLSGFFRAQIVA